MDFLRIKICVYKITRTEVIVQPGKNDLFSVIVNEKFLLLKLNFVVGIQLDFFKSNL